MGERWMSLPERICELNLGDTPADLWMPVPGADVRCVFELESTPWGPLNFEIAITDGIPHRETYRPFGYSVDEPQMILQPGALAEMIAVLVGASSSTDLTRHNRIQR